MTPTTTKTERNWRVFVPEYRRWSGGMTEAAARRYQGYHPGSTLVECIDRTPPPDSGDVAVPAATLAEWERTLDAVRPYIPSALKNPSGSCYDQLARLTLAICRMRPVHYS